jgi:hypothetical protein
MRIAWGRGCFRLWVIATVVWACFAAVLLRPELASYGTWMQAASFALGKPVSERTPLLLGASRPTPGVSNMGASNVGAANIGASNAYAPPSTDAFVAAVAQADRFASRKTIAWFAWIVGGPSLLALLCGLALTWVVRGFVGWQPARRTPVLPS